MRRKSLLDDSSSKKLLDYSSHRADELDSSTRSLAGGKKGRRRSRPGSSAIDEALSTTEQLLALPLDLAIPISTASAKPKKTRGRTRTQTPLSELHMSTTNPLASSCSNRLRDTLQRRMDCSLEDQSSRHEREQVQALLGSSSGSSSEGPTARAKGITARATSTGSTLAPSATAIKPPKLSRTVSDPLHDIVPSYRWQNTMVQDKISFALKKRNGHASKNKGTARPIRDKLNTTAAAAMSQSMHCYGRSNDDLLGDNSSTHRLHQSLLHMHLAEEQERGMLAVPENQEMEICDVPDHRRQRITSLDDCSMNSESMTIHEDEREDDDSDEDDEPQEQQPVVAAAPKTTSSRQTRRQSKSRSPVPPAGRRSSSRQERRQQLLDSSQPENQQPSWVSRPKSVTDIATKMYKKYNTLALSLSGSNPPEQEEQPQPPLQGGKPKRRSSLSPLSVSDSARHRRQSHMIQGMNPSSLYQNLDLSDSALTLGSHSERGARPKAIDLRNLLKARERSPRRGSSHSPHNSNRKLDRLNASMCNLLDDSTNDLLSISMQRRPSTTTSKQRNARWSPKRDKLQRATTDPGYRLAKPDRTKSKSPKRSSMPSTDKLAFLASLNRSSSTAAGSPPTSNSMSTLRNSTNSNNTQPPSLQSKSKLALLASLNRSSSMAAGSPPTSTTSNNNSKPKKLAPFNGMTSAKATLTRDQIQNLLAKASNSNISQLAKKWTNNGMASSSSSQTTNTAPFPNKTQSSLQTMGARVLSNKMAPVVSSNSNSNFAWGSSSKKNSNSNFSWAATSANTNRGSPRKRAEMAANPFLSIVQRTAAANQRPIAKTSSLASIPQTTTLTRTTSNKRIKALASDGVTVVSRNSSYASLVDHGKDADVAMADVGGLRLTKNGSNNTGYLPQKLEGQPEGTSVLYSEKVYTGTVDAAEEVQRLKASKLSKKLKRGTSTGTRLERGTTDPGPGITANPLYQLLLQNQSISQTKATQAGSGGGPRLMASASAMNLHQKSSAAMMGKLGNRVAATARRTTSRANLMSDSFANDPSHFVTGSRIRRFQSSGGLSLLS